MAARAVIGELDVSTARIDCPSQHCWRFTRGPLTSTVFTALHVLPEGELQSDPVVVQIAHIPRRAPMTLDAETSDEATSQVSSCPRLDQR